MDGNAILRHPTLTILQQIEELKTWHKQQELKMNENEPNDKGGQGRKAIRSAKEKNTLHTQLEANVSKQQVDFDELPIKATNPNLYNAIENNITPGNTQLENFKNSSEHIEKPKFRFLKKGEGIARFRMGPSRKPKYRSIQSNSLKPSGTSKSNIKQHQEENQEKIHCKIGDTEQSNRIPTLEPPDLKLDIKKTWKSIFDSGQAEEIMEKAIDNNLLDLFQPNSTIDSSTASLIEKFMLVGEFVKEKEEQHIFNLMEQHVMDSSFSSTSTYVEHLMKNAIISTPVKHHPSRNPVPPKAKTCPIDKPVSESENEEYAIKLDDVNIKDKILFNNTLNNVEEQSKAKEHENSLDHSVHVRFAEQVDYKSFSECSQSFNNLAPKELQNSVKEIDEGDEWKDDSSSCCSQCDAVNDSSIQDGQAIKSTHKSSPTFPPQNPKQLQSIGSNDYDLNTPECNPTERIHKKGLNSNDNVQLEHTTSEPCNCPADIIKKKNELDREIKIIAVENNIIRKMRENLERERKQFQRDKKKFLKELDEEKKKNILQLDEERKKLAKEKSVFERYSKSLTKNPTRDERREIQVLQDQLSEIKLELNKKETRWGSAQARVRNQVNVLERDNKKLKDEIEVLRKQAKHLELMTQKRKGKPFNNTKLIHDINSCISNIVIEDADLSKESQEVGYFKPNASVKTVAIDNLDSRNLTSVKVLKENTSKSKTVVVGDNSRNTVASSEEDGVMTNSNRLNQDLSSTQECVGQEVTALSVESSSESIKAKASLSPNSCREIVTADGNVELIYPDGRKQIRYKNGNIKKIDLYSGSEKMIYFNGDVREVSKDGTVKYFYFESRTWQTTLPNGLEIFDFPNQQVEKRHANGMVESIYPDGKKQITYPDGSAEIHYPDDGRVLKIEPEHKRQVLLMPNGQKEIRTDNYVRREYPDGTIRTVHPDGTIETVYSNGRVRLKDKHGNLVMDSGSLSEGRL